MAQAKKPTINDVARLAGLSKKTVSRVMNDEGFVSEETRRRVRQIATEIGYQPDRRARALAARRSFIIGLAFDNANASYVLDLLQGALSAANARGYEIITHPAGAAGATATDVADFIARSGIDGVILSPPMSEFRDIAAALQSWGCPVVRIAGDDAAIDAHQVRFDDRSAAVEMTAHLIGLGHTRIGFVGGTEDLGPSRRRLAGHLDALSARGLALAAEHTAWGDFTFASGVQCGHRLLSLPQRPTAIFCCNDEMAAGVIHAARELGLDVPGDVSVTGFDDAPIALQLWPTLTTVKQPVREMGATAASRLIDQIEAAQPRPAVDELRHSLVLRESTAPPAP